MRRYRERGPRPPAVPRLRTVGEVRISAVVPAYNEEEGIAATLAALAGALEPLEPFEILVVDNASEDRTVERLRALGDERVRLLEGERNRGKGHSVRRGMLAARGELRLHCDADCAASLASLPAMLELAERHDLVVGSRLAPGASLGRRQPLRRRIAGRSFQQLCRLALREPVTDLFCGFKLWRGPAAQDVFARVSLEGWTFDAEAIALARGLGYRIAETGIAWADREGSRLAMSRVLVPVTRELRQARATVRREVARGPRATAPAVAEPVP